MSRQYINHTIHSIGVFASATRSLVKDKPELLDGTIEDLINHAMLEILERYFDPGDREPVGQLFREICKKAVLHETVVSVASEPIFGLKTPGSHLVFAESWAAYAMSTWTVRGGPMNISEGINTIVPVCCNLLALWSKASYRMDWHPVDSETERADPAAPVGQWTKEWAKRKEAEAAQEREREAERRRQTEEAACLQAIVEQNKHKEQEDVQQQIKEEVWGRSLRARLANLFGLRRK